MRCFSELYVAHKRRICSKNNIFYYVLPNHSSTGFDKHDTLFRSHCSATNLVHFFFQLIGVNKHGSERVMPIPYFFHKNLRLWLNWAVGDKEVKFCTGTF